MDELWNCEYNGAVVTKTCTLEAREGNAFPRVSCADDGSVSINSVGLANLGVDTYLKWLEGSSDIFKPVFLSIGGLSKEENMKLLREIREASHPPDFVELNVSCPNLVGSTVTGYDTALLYEYLSILMLNITIMREKGVDIGCGVKLPPYFDDCSFQSVADIINDFEELDYITTINGVPNCLVIDTKTEAPVIKPKNGHGGLGGGVTKPIGLANVATFRKYLDPRIKIIGCGGVCTGEDVFQYLLCGADAVEIGTQFLHEGVTCFERICVELQELMRGKGYHNITEFQGKLCKK
uniref:Dihydroorotate dehydrogenase n=1 Tax=Pithovirus LCPAC304 TaxID=2506594 RepID=A0A481ZAJ8_9VIRU|nr:MAG: dihydroorotate dehydrogenase [Pithovirus LCPAC304]